MSGDADILYKGEWLTVRAMKRKNGKRPAREWFDNLDKQGKAKVLAAAQNVENSMRSGRPLGWRAAKVKISDEGLWELRVTPPGASPPHLRLLFKRVVQTLWVTSGFTKQKNVLEKNDVQLGDNIAREWGEHDQ